jgi:PhnB protein
MAKAKSYIPSEYHSVTPYLTIKGAARALDFYRNAFGAHERMRMPGPNGQIMHAEIKIGNSIIMLSDEFPEMGAKSPQTLGGSPSSLMIYTENVDTMFAQALREGAEEVRPVKDQFYGDRMGTLRDPFGHVWTVATHIEDLTDQEIAERAKKVMGAGCTDGNH